MGGPAPNSPIVAAPPMTLRCAQRKLEIEPERLPRFVRFPEFGGVEVGDAFDQFIPSIARDHWRCSDQVTDRRCASNDPSLRSSEPGNRARAPPTIRALPRIRWR